MRNPEGRKPPCLHKGKEKIPLKLPDLSLSHNHRAEAALALHVLPTPLRPQPPVSRQIKGVTEGSAGVPHRISPPAPTQQWEGAE